MNSFKVFEIGRICADESGFSVKLAEEYIPALSGLEGFEYIQLLYWFDRCDNAISRAKLVESKPYTNGPEVVGTFATRSPERPNPIALSTAYVTYIDKENGVVGLAYTDALDGTPVLDIKPYTPSLDRVEKPAVPEWCAHWPDCVEESGEFDWAAEFNF
ncbi:MAG: SAM-dependent methyltransferase [Clostridiales bacterium]|nr:SAM-dependent methyltransferase [Clostridiales bacterium]